jgi:hypothetical protein
MAVATAAFLLALTLLAWQLRAGRDPAIGMAKATTPAPQRVLVRRIHRKVIVVDPPAATAPATAAPARTTSAPARTAPAPVAVAAPAAPAPVVTRSS